MFISNAKGTLKIYTHEKRQNKTKYKTQVNVPYLEALRTIYEHFQ